MRKTILFGAVLLGATLLVAETLQPLRVKTGLWQMTETVTWTGLPPQAAAVMKNGQPINYKSCVKKEDLSGNPWQSRSRQNCKWTVLKSTGTDMELRGTLCDVGNNPYHMTAEAEGKIHVIDSGNGTGSFDITMTGTGQTMKGHVDYTGKWIGATCPADMN